MNKRFKLFVVTGSTCLLIMLLVGARLGKSASTDEGAYRHMAVFQEVLARIKSDYVEEPNLQNVTLGAVNGLLESVDPFASFLNADQYKQYLKEKDAYKGDIGAVLSKRYGYVGVVSALPGSPAEKAGLATGDLIESIKGVATRDMPLAYAEILLKGQPGTEVEISLMHLPDPEAQKIKLIRAVIVAGPVTQRMLAAQTGYIRPDTLSAARVAEIAAAVRDLEKQGAKGFVLDLRQCAVGTPEDGLALANLFVQGGLLTYLQGQKTPRQDFYADASKNVTRLPLVVATNRGTAAGAEIAASAMLDNKRAQVVGERTYGDAAVRRAITMDDGSAVILSVAKYYNAAGKTIQDTGVVPSVPYLENEAALDQEAEDAPVAAPKPAAPTRPEDDGLLKRAIEVLTKGPGPAAQKQPEPAAPKAPATVPPSGDTHPEIAPKQP